MWQPYRGAGVPAAALGNDSIHELPLRAHARLRRRGGRHTSRGHDMDTRTLAS